MATATAPRRAIGDAQPPSRRHRSFIRRPTTVLAAAVLAGSAVIAVAMQGHGAAGSIAARVGQATISDSAVEREVSAIETQPAYAAALGRTSTLALAAPVDPKAVAAANGDPDDLRITFSPVGGSGTRPYTTVDLRAAVLTRLIYLSALRQLLVAKHVAPTASEAADGLQEARLHAGVDASGASLFDTLPAWYQAELAARGADAEAFVRAEIGTGGVTPADVQLAYDRRLSSDFTTVCLRSIVVPETDLASGRAALTSGGPGSRDDGCAPLGQWARDVALAVRNAAAGTTGAQVVRGSNVALLEVTHRSQIPLSAVVADVRATLLSGHTDLINNIVGDELSLLHVTVAPQYGTYENFASLHEVLPPDALAPASPASARPSSPAPAPTHTAGQLDPFD